MHTRLLLLLALIGCHSGGVLTHAENDPPFVPPPQVPEQLSRTGEPPMDAGPLRPEALELTLPSGSRVQITSTGEVTEIVGRHSWPVPLRPSRRKALQQAFATFSSDSFGWLSYVPPDLVEVIVLMRYEGKWVSGPTYRKCGKSDVDDSRWITHRTNAFVDEVATLAGYPAFRCPEHDPRSIP